MAATIRLVTFSGQTVTPKNDAIVYDSAVGRCGVFYGCDVTASGNTLYIANGYGMIRGRFFEIKASTVSVTLASTDTLMGRLYIRVDLSNAEAPCQLLTYTGSSLPSLEQDADANFIDGVWEMELATFSVATTEINNVVETFEIIEDNNSRIEELNSNLNTVNIESIQRVATTVTTGATGNIALPHDNTGKIFVVAPLAAGSNTYLRAWVAGGGNQWYLTAIDPNTGATQNNRSLSIRYLVVTIKNS